MANLKYYCIDVELTGRLTQLPDSQKIFGALIHQFSNQYSSVEASTLVNKIKDGSTVLTISNLLPHGYMPVPHVELLERFEAVEVDNKQRKVTYKEMKKRSFLKLDQIKGIVDGTQQVDSVYPYIQIKPTQQIHASIDSVRYNIPGLDPNLFSVPEIIVQEMAMMHGVEHTQVIKQFQFYIAVIEDIELMRLLDMLNVLKMQQTRLVLGPRSSQGLNTYQIKNISEDIAISLRQSGSYLNLGMLLPSVINYDKSALKLFTSERRPYNPIGGWDAERVGQFISFIEAGSIIFAQEGVEHAGRSIESPFYNRDVVFGNSLLYPVCWKEN